METWFTQIIEWLPEGGNYIAVIAFVAFLESIVAIGLMVPGSTFIVLAGFLALHGKGEIVSVMLAGMGGALLGDIVSYWAGARIGARLIQSRFLQKRLKLLRHAEIYFVEHGGKSIFFGRFIGPIRGFIPFVAGSARMRPRPFALYALVSAIIWGLAYPALGYLAGASWKNVQVWSGRFGLLVALLLILTIGWVLANRRFRGPR